MSDEIYEVLIAKRSLAELRKGHANVVMGAIARPRQIVGDRTAVLAVLTVVEIKTSARHSRKGKRLTLDMVGASILPIAVRRADTPTPLPAPDAGWRDAMEKARSADEMREALKGQHPVFAFLLGVGPLDGMWFSDPRPLEKGAYWWRKHLRAALSPLPAPPVGDGSAEPPK